MLNIATKWVLPLDDSNGRMTRWVKSRHTLGESSSDHQMAWKGTNNSPGDTKIISKLIKEI